MTRCYGFAILIMLGGLKAVLFLLAALRYICRKWVDNLYAHNPPGNLEMRITNEDGGISLFDWRCGQATERGCASSPGRLSKKSPV